MSTFARALPRHCAWLCMLGACATQDASTVRIETGDPTAFAQHVQPYLQTACATLDCHGDPGRPLRLYAELGLRNDDALRSQPIAEHADPMPLTGAELDANLHSLGAVGLGARAPREQLALRKPLAAAAGGIHHVGGVHWSTREDPGYLCLRQFLLGDTTAELGDACARALDALQR